LIRPANDKRVYKEILLENGIKVLLISDPSTQISAASMDVGVGSMSNPENLLGLAHFLEHMLFRGSKKYPETSKFVDYVVKNSG